MSPAEIPGAGGEMVLLIVGLVLFLGMHAVAVVGLREPAVARLGEGAWKGLYSLVSVAGLVALVWGYGEARLTPTLLWSPPIWTRHLALTLLIPVFPLLLAAYLPGRIRSVTKHPMLLAVKIWATAHLLSNGMLADVVLFGSLLAWAVVVRISLKRRVARPVPGAPPSPYNDVIALVVGLILYVATVLKLHVWLIGVAPIG